MNTRILLSLLFSFAIYNTPVFAADQPKPETTESSSEEYKGTDFYGPDGMLDVSGFLKQKYGFFAMPMILTSPALGWGGGINLVYLHDKLAEKFDEQAGRYIPPSISGAALVGTENGTRFGGAYHIGFWKKDTIRTTTFAGVPDVNINFYPDKKYLPRELKVEMNLKGFVGYQDVKFRIGDSAWFLGGDYMYSTLDTRPKNDTGYDELDDLLNINSTLNSFSLKALYDTRNSMPISMTHSN